MAKFKIPPTYKKGFQILLGIDKAKVDKLIKNLSTAKYGTFPDDLKKTIPSELLKPDDASEVVESIWSVYQLNRKNKYETNELIDDIIKALIEIKFTPKDKNWERFKTQFSKLLNITNIRLTNKTQDLSSEFEKIFVESRILTDIRLAFEDEIEKDSQNGVIIHNLRIEFHQDKGHDKFIVALDTKDLKQLSEQIVRAQKKETLIKKKFQKAINFI